MTLLELARSMCYENHVPGISNMASLAASEQSLTRQLEQSDELDVQMALPASQERMSADTFYKAQGPPAFLFPEAIIALNLRLRMTKMHSASSIAWDQVRKLKMASATSSARISETSRKGKWLFPSSEND